MAEFQLKKFAISIKTSNIKHQHKEMKKKKHIKIHRLIQKTLLQINLYEVTGAPAALNLNKPKRNLKKASE